MRRRTGLLFIWNEMTVAGSIFLHSRTKENEVALEI
jgi:hypothetical protein